MKIDDKLDAISTDHFDFLFSGAHSLHHRRSEEAVMRANDIRERS